MNTVEVCECYSLFSSRSKGISRQIRGEPSCKKCRGKGWISPREEKAKPPGPVNNAFVSYPDEY